MEAHFVPHTVHSNRYAIDFLAPSYHPCVYHNASSGHTARLLKVERDCLGVHQRYSHLRRHYAEDHDIDPSLRSDAEALSRVAGTIQCNEPSTYITVSLSRRVLFFCSQHGALSDIYVVMILAIISHEGSLMANLLWHGDLHL